MTVRNYKILNRKYTPVVGQDITFWLIDEATAASTKDHTVEQLLKLSIQVTLHVQFVDPQWGPNITRVQGYQDMGEAPARSVITHYDSFSVNQKLIGIAQISDNTQDD